MIKKEDVFKIGTFAKPHGIKGEIGLVTEYDLTGDSDDPYLVCEIEGILVPFFIESCRTKTSTVVLVKLATLDTEEAVRALANQDAYYPLDALGGEEEEEGDLDVAWDILAGYSLIDEKHGELGEITDVDESTINILLQIDHQGEELLIPAVEEWVVSVDHRKKHLKVSIPEGLLEL
ncbi:ribosome maturation factor RimM [Bacteroidia bacterium]|nr:ribosome maturation factor RimM [Bacteroidia bacterium]